MVTFLIAHISDLHLSTNPNRYGIHHVQGFWGRLTLFLQNIFAYEPAKLTGSYDERSLTPLAERLAEGFYPESMPATQLHYDAIVISGDIATHGSLIEQEAAKKLLDRIVGRSIELNTQLILPIVPGNHDRYQKFRNLPGSLEFENQTTFQPNWCPYHIPSPILGNRPYQRVQAFSVSKASTTLTFISIDCSLKSKNDVRGFLAYLDKGVATRELLDDVRQSTLLAQEQRHAVVWIVHFPPVPQGRAQFLGGQDLLLKLANELSVELILSGHTHCDEMHDFTSGSTSLKVVVAGSALAFGESVSYKELRLDVDAQSLRISLVEAPTISRNEVVIDHQASCYVFSR